jgi:hypothetical protein
MGARFRMRSTLATTGYGPYARRVINMMKHYVLVLADNGSPWFFKGSQTASWPLADRGRSSTSQPPCASPPTRLR